MSDHDNDIDTALGAWTPMEPPADFVDRVLAARGPALPVKRSKRAWWLAAPVAAAAMIAIVVFATSNDVHRTVAVTTRSASDTEVRAFATPEAGSASGVIAMGSGANSATNHPVSVDAGVANVTQGFVDTASSTVAIGAGTSAVVHDMSPTTPVQIDVATRCPTGATVTASRERDGARGAETATATGLTHAVITIDTGLWKYEVRCANDPGTLAAEGTVRLVHDDGRRKLASDPTTKDIVSDGRTWRVSFVSRAPALHVRAPAGASSLTLRKDDSMTRYDIENGIVVIPEGTLSEGRYTLTDDNKRAKVTTVLVERETAVLAIGRIRELDSGGMKITGRALRGWGVDINGVRATLYKSGAFEGDVGFGAVVLRASHDAKAETHFYVLPAITK